MSQSQIIANITQQVNKNPSYLSTWFVVIKACYRLLTCHERSVRGNDRSDARNKEIRGVRWIYMIYAVQRIFRNFNIDHIRIVKIISVITIDNLTIFVNVIPSSGCKYVSRIKSFLLTPLRACTLVRIKVRVVSWTVIRRDSIPCYTYLIMHRAIYLHLINLSALFV